MGPFGPSPMLGLGETFDLLKIMFLCSKVHFLNLIYTEVYVTMDSKMFLSLLKLVNYAAIAISYRYADLNFYMMVINK